MLLPSSFSKEATPVSEPSAPQGPSGPDEKVSVSWLILQRLDDLKEQIAAVSARVDRVEAQMAARFDAVDRRFEAMDRRFDALERRWTWALGLILVMALGLLAKLLLPGA
jgi:hypothetical protein